MWSRALAILLVSFVLAACQHDDSIGSILKGECQLVKSPPYAVLGKTSYDQAWINETTEGIVTGCRQPRPKARPKELDQAKRITVPVAPPAKRKWRQKLRDAVS